MKSTCSDSLLLTAWWSLVSNLDTRAHVCVHACVRICVRIIIVLSDNLSGRWGTSGDYLVLSVFVCLPLLLPLSLCIGGWRLPKDRGLLYLRANFSVGDMVCACDVQNCPVISLIHSLYSPMLLCRSLSRISIEQTLHRYI